MKNNSSYQEKILSYFFQAIEVYQYKAVFATRYNITSKAQAELYKRLTHIKDDSFFNSRKELYSQIIDSVLKPNGKLITPASGTKRKFILVSTYTSARHELMRRLFNNDKTLPDKALTAFNKVNNGHAIKIDFDEIIKKFPEYNAALEEGYAYPSYVVHGEVNALCDAIRKYAMEKGLNVIDLSSTYAYEMKNEKIEAFKGVSNTTKSNRVRKYKLTSFCLAGDIETLQGQPMDSLRNTSETHRNGFIKGGMKKISKPDSFQNLMNKSDNAFLVWDNGNRFGNKLKFTLTASSEKGIHKFHERPNWDKFRQFQHLGGSYAHDRSKSYAR